MIVALIDNGSLEPGATRNLRAVAAALGAETGVTVHPVSWKHSDRVPAAALDGEAAATLKPWMRTQLARGERDFVFVPFFISAQGAIGSALRTDLEKLQSEAGAFTFTEGLADRGAIPQIVAARVRETLAAHKLSAATPVVLVDHGGPSPASAALRDALAAQVGALLACEVAVVAPASMEGGDHAHNRPLLADRLAAPDFAGREVVVALLFLSPGRHAGAGGDIAEICAVAETATPGLRCHLTGLIGTHPRAVAPLAAALRGSLAPLITTLHA